jgi:hypothetical protein
MKAAIRRNRLAITLDVQKAKKSGSGKTLVIASSHGARTTTVMWKGIPVVINANAFVYVTPKNGARRAEKTKRKGTRE